MSHRIAIPIYSFVLSLIEHQGRYLLVQEAKPQIGDPWYFPAGGIEPGEDLITAAKREAQEEAGVEISPKYIISIEHNIPAKQNQKSPSPEQWRFFLISEYLAGEPKEKADKESIQAKWFFPEELSELHLRTPRVKELIEQHHQGKLTQVPIELYKFHFF